MSKSLSRIRLLAVALVLAGAAVVRAQDLATAPTDPPPKAPPATPVPQQAKPAATDERTVLPDAIDVATLRRALAETPPSVVVLDVRPAWQFSEFHVPGAVNVTAADALAKVAALPTGARAVIVDRDGTTAFGVAALARPSDGTRTVLALDGGTRAWWRASNSSFTTSAPGPNPPAGTPKAAPPKRPAGC